MTTDNTTSDDTVPFDHRHIALENRDDVYVVGDVHGCPDALEALLDRLDLGGNDLAVFVGDLVRKGPDSKAVLDRIRRSPRLISVRGNNERKLIDGETSLPTLDSVDLQYLESLPTAISWDGGLVVHGGIDPSRPLPNHDADDVLTMRSPNGDGYDGPFWFETYEGPPRVFFGHTVLAEPVDREWAVGLDTGCVYGGDLTAYDVRRERFLSVPGATHEDRSSEKIVTLER
ncbi:metallophosphoesterase family protein [Natrinema sp. 1APR25-10V2]|uniref:metallophosphoesterase family protein n=1 Tax=Natrinema sp. 1APR25-10V2 TaxID=2951081 RepID=UPI0028759EEA|nr:metallophosphoesterase family protein [Natrinema sp. 1APR25-10V2]MDS0478437.1 serine/threonine protein phosphatase [Natrinema sp. 1APR25-10V2]